MTTITFSSDPHFGLVIRYAPAMAQGMSVVMSIVFGGEEKI